MSFKARKLHLKPALYHLPPVANGCLERFDSLQGCATEISGHRLFETIPVAGPLGTFRFRVAQADGGQ
jgi:hypothetical protein